MEQPGKLIRDDQLLAPRNGCGTEAGVATQACLSCGRTRIGSNYDRVPPARVFVAMFFVYAPILLLPFILLSAVLVYVHLRLIGASQLKTLHDFLPAWDSHRYRYKTQIVKRDIHPLARWARTRLFWVFNCTVYCPLSVAILQWATYLTKTVENWWCPFAHARKRDYADAAIDYSFWHISRDVDQLHPQDRSSSVWNQDAGRP
jgi:hypothetical protein